MSGLADLFNAALDLIGQNETRLMSPDDDSLSARLCKARYPSVRDELLQAHPWNFAQKRVLLSEDANPPAWGYGRAYSLPADCLQVETLACEDPWQTGTPWQVEGGRILTDSPAPLAIRYIARMEDVTVFPALFREALVCRLAAVLARPLAQSGSLAEAMLRRSEDLLRLAKTRDAQEAQAPEHALSGWVLARQ